jgi:hypothetical protein
MDRLPSTRKIDDRQSPHGESDVVLKIEPVLIRTAMLDRAVHPFEDPTIDGTRAVINYSYNSTHNN